MYSYYILDSGNTLLFKNNILVKSIENLLYIPKEWIEISL